MDDTLYAQKFYRAFAYLYEFDEDRVASLLKDDKIKALYLDFLAKRDSNILSSARNLQMQISLTQARDFFNN